MRGVRRGVVGGGARARPPLSLDARGDVPRQVEHVVRPGVQGSDVSPAVPRGTSPGRTRVSLFLGRSTAPVAWKDATMAGWS